MENAVFIGIKKNMFVNNFFNQQNGASGESAPQAHEKQKLTGIMKLEVATPLLEAEKTLLACKEKILGVFKSFLSFFLKEASLYRSHPCLQKDFKEKIQRILQNILHLKATIQESKVRIEHLQVSV